MFILITDGIFETGACGVPSKSQNQNLGLRMHQFQKYHPLIEFPLWHRCYFSVSSKFYVRKDDMYKQKNDEEMNEKMVD